MDSKKSLGSIAKGTGKKSESNETSTLKNNDTSFHQNKKVKSTDSKNNTREKNSKTAPLFQQKSIGNLMNSDEKNSSKASIDSNQTSSVSRIMRNTSLSLTSSSSSGQTSKRLVIKNLKGHFFIS